MPDSRLHLLRPLLWLKKDKYQDKVKMPGYITLHDFINVLRPTQILGLELFIQVRWGRNSSDIYIHDFEVDDSCTIFVVSIVY